MSTNNEVFQEVYPFTTEAIGGYFENINFEGKSVLTVGSSLDQAFNASLFGAKNIVVYDINKNTEIFYKLKRDKVLSVPRTEFYKEVLKIDDVPFSKYEIFPERVVIDSNPYLQSDENYELLRQRLVNDNISFVCGDIFDMDSSIGNEKFDIMIFSNILQYLEYFANDADIYKFLKENFDKWKEHLNDNGLLQLLYLYTFTSDDVGYEHHLATYNLRDVINALGFENLLRINSFWNCVNDKCDSVVTYTKER